MVQLEEHKKTQDDARETVISVQDVSMVFNMANEQLNSLKEYAIQIARHKLFFQGFNALNHVSFEVKKGDVFGIVGTNGSGKSTMLKIIAGVLEPSSGTCTTKGNIAPLIELGAGFDPDLSARENIYLNGALLGYSKEFIDKHFDDIVSFAEIEQFLDMPLKNYSSGMTARIAFAVATVIVPDILIVDEVLSVGDFMFQRKCEDRIRSLIDQYGTTVLIVSHSSDLIDSMCNKAIWIEKGNVKLLGDAKEVSAAYMALGGRAGSSESEAKLYQEIKHSLSVSNDALESKQVIIPGSDYVATTVSCASHLFKKSNQVLLAGGNTHANTIIACGLAGALNEPILISGDGVIPDLTAQALTSLKTNEVLYVDQNKDEEHASNGLRSYTDSKLSHWFTTKECLKGSLEIINYGVQDNLWGETLAVINFKDNTESFALAPYLYHDKCPILLLGDNDQLTQPLLEELHNKIGFKRVLLVATASTQENKGLFENLNISIVNFCEDTIQQNCLEIAKWVAIQDGFSFDSLAIADADIGHWPYLLVSPIYCGKTGTPLLLADMLSYDNTLACLDFVKEQNHKTKKLVFFGQNSVEKTNQKLFLAQLFD